MIANRFEMGPEGWCSYDYHATIVTGREFFVMSTWCEGAGPQNTNSVCVDHCQWSADTPESPISILALINYRNWANLGPIDLRDAELSVYLRGDALQLEGASCYFWVNSGANRWHLTAHPLQITEGTWADAPNQVTLTNQEALWHNTWSGKPPVKKSLDLCLREASSYGFSFIGYGSEVQGLLSMAEFLIAPPR